MVIMVLATVLRLIAVLFARGYGMHDDHFCVIETAQQWAEGHEIPSPSRVPKRNLIYIGLHAVFFRSLDELGLRGPQGKMYAVRLVHAVYSLLAVWFGLKLVRQLTDERTARLVGLGLAAFWVFPYMSVRNLVEYVCVPPLVVAVWFAVREDGSGGLRDGFLAGLAGAVAFTIRYQVASFLAVVGLLLLVRKQLRQTVALVGGFSILCVLTLGIPEWLLLDAPFATAAHYFAHNVAHARSYVTSPWFTYIGTILAAFIPPFSVALVWGLFSARRGAPMVFWPTLAFFAIHSAYPNKQERFILPVIPFILIGGVVGLRAILHEAPRSAIRSRLLRALWVWFWAVNALLLGVSLVTYSKKTGVESMSYLRERADVTALVVENHRSSSPRMPLFYLGERVPVYDLPSSRSPESLGLELHKPDAAQPNYVIFLGSKKLDSRIRRVRRLFPGLDFETKIAPSLVDQLLYALNPEHNVNQTSYIYRISQDS